MSDFSVVSHSGGVLVLNLQMEYNTKYRIMMSSDRHFDSRHNDQKLENYHLSQLTDNDAIIDIGDLFDAMQGRQDRRRSLADLKQEHKQENYFDALVESAVRRYGPYADKILALGHGNHETAVIKHYGTDLTSRLAAALSPEIKMIGYCGYIILRCKYRERVKKSIVIRYHHGSGGGAVVTKGRIKANRRAVVYSNADIVWSGHTHQADIMHVAKERVNRIGKIEGWIQTHVVTPGYKRFGQWETEREFLPEPRGCAWLSVLFCDNTQVKSDISLDVN